MPLVPGLSLPGVWHPTDVATKHNCID